MELESLLRLAAAAISRLQTHQLSGLAQTSTLPDGTQLATWQMEVPMRHQHSVVPLQVKFREEQRKTGEEARESLWRVELAFDRSRWDRCTPRRPCYAAACPASFGPSATRPRGWSSMNSATCANACATPA